MEYNEKDFPKRIYNVLWNGNLMMLLRLNPDKFKISNVDEMGMPYAHIRMLDCKRGDSRKMLAEEFGVTENTISVTLTLARRKGFLSAYKHIGRPRITEE